MSVASKLATAGLLAVLSIAPLHAQQDTAANTADTVRAQGAVTPTTTASATTLDTTSRGTVTRYDDRSGFDWGWLGLLGLFGLLGLRRLTNVVYHDRDRDYQDRRTTT
jgi:MYXO-CTERM domain-containing protein